MKKSFTAIAVLICLFTTFAVPISAAAPVYLFLTSGTDATIDETLIARIKSLGFDVEVKTHDTFDAAADSAGKVAVYISESVTSGNILDAFKDITVPVVFSEAYLIEDMGLCGPTDSVDFGSNTNHSRATVIKPDHPIMKGVSKDYTVITAEGLDPAPNYCWALVPEKNAIAVDPDAPDHAVVWAYEKGDTTVDGLIPPYTVPEKRCAVNWHTSMPTDAVSADMWKIFDNAIIWAAGLDPLAPPETEAPVIEETPASVITTNPKTADAGLVLFVFTAAALCAVLTFKKKR